MKTETLNSMVGEKAIIRTYSAGVWFGKIIEKFEKEVIVENARRLWYWKANASISLSAVAVYGLDSSSKIAPAVDKVWLEAIEIIPVSAKIAKDIEELPDAEAA